jgi:hypothetical protein
LRIVAPPAAEVIGAPEMIRSIERRLREIALSILDVEAVWLLPQIDPADFAAIVETGARLGARFVLAVGNDPEPQRKLNNFAHLAESARAVASAPCWRSCPSGSRLPSRQNAPVNQILPLAGIGCGECHIELAHTGLKHSRR